MVDYRVYLIDEANHIRQAQDLAADSDEAAMALAQELADGQRFEVWCRTRLVGRAEPVLRQA